MITITKIKIANIVSKKRIRRQKFKSPSSHKLQSLTFPLILILTLPLILFLALILIIGNPSNLSSPVANISVPVSFTAQTTNSEDSKNIKMLFMGDVMFSRSIGYQVLNGVDPFKNIKDKFNEYNILVANLETVVSRSYFLNQAGGKLFTFNSPLESLDVLNNNRINVVSLANNHTMDFGTAALINTMDNLKSKGILYVGAGGNESEAFAPKYLIYKDLIISFLAFNDIENWFANASPYSAGSAYFDKSKIQESINSAKASSDIVIVMPHWGLEYSLTNSDRQSEYGKFFIDSGADIVIGAHPHVLQNQEEYKGKTIYYSLGNFVFDDMCTIPNACDTALLEVNIENKKIVGSNLIPVRISDEGFPFLK